MAATICLTDGFWPVAPTFFAFLGLYSGVVWLDLIRPVVESLDFDIQLWE